MKHTPGPWKVYKDSREINYVVTNGTGGIGNQDCKASYIDTDANAHLISAAPELLAACRELTQEFRNHYNVLHMEGPEYVIWHRAMAAIDKAEGRD